MIVFERAEPVIRTGEVEIAGRRIAARILPYVGEAGPAPFRFDPVSGSLIRCSPGGRVEAGPAQAEAWRRALNRTPAGPVLVGPVSPAEPLRGAALAAGEGARAAGHAVYLLDPPPSALPDMPGEAYVALFCGLPGEALWRHLEAAARQMPSGLVLPVLPGWTTEDEFLETLFRRAAAAGAGYLTALRVASDGGTRRRAVEARGILEPGSVEAYFDRVHHGDWEGESSRAIARMHEEAARRGLAPRPPRPRADGEPAGNAAAAARLEELADAEGSGEHAAARLRAAVRWIDELGRDLAPIVEEGNFQKVFPFGAEIASEVEKALGALAR